MFNGIKAKISDIVAALRENVIVEKVQSFYDSLPDEQQKMAIAGSVIVIVLVVSQIFLSLNSMISTKQAQIEESIQIIGKLNKLNTMVFQNKSEIRRLKQLSNIGKNVSLLEVIEKHQNLAMIKVSSRESIREMPRKIVEDKFYENTAMLKYRKISIRQLVNLLYGVEQSGVATKITSLRIKRRFDDDRYIDAEFDITTRVPK